MKFGKYLEAEQVPEWEKMYVDYKHLKRRIKEIAAAQERNRKSQRGDEHVSLLKRASTYLGYDSFNLDHHASHTHGESSGVDYRRTPAQGSGYGSCTTKDCTRCQHFSRVVSATPQIAIGMSAGNSGNVSSTPVELAHGANIKIPLSAQDSFTETIRRRRGSVSPRGGGSMSTAFKKELGVRIEEEQEFFADMEHELAKVNDFFRQKQDLFHSRFDNIIEQQRMLDEMVGEEAEAATLHSPPKGHEQVSGSGSKLRRLTALSSAPDSNLPGPSAPLRAAKSKIKRAMLELYRGIEMLKNYRILCYTAFIKALKKYQKTAKWCDGTDYFLDRVDGCYMATSPDLNMLARELEGMYIERHAGGSRSKGMDTLRINTSGTSRDNQGSTFRSGLLLGTSFPLIIRAIYESNLISNEDRVPYHRELLQIYGGIFL
ncbi:Signal transduction protein, partial [Linderina pennispora]